MMPRLGTALITLPLLLAACSGARAETIEAEPGLVPPTALVEAELPERGTVASLVEQVSPSVVNITIRKAAPASLRMPFGNLPLPFGGQLPFGDIPFGETPSPMREGAGSGFIIDPKGYVVTNAHVVDGADEVTVRLKDEREYVARVVGTDRDLDLALLKIDDNGALPAARLGDSDALKVGAHVVAVGNPFGLGHTVTLGIVSAKERTIGAGPYDDFIQTDASINPGNSGGPLFNLRGEVIGINTAIRPGADGIGFAIPINDLKDILPQLKDKGFVERGRLGVRFQPIDGALAKALGLDKPRGALVAEVEKDSPAEKAGMRIGDVIVRVGNEEVRHAVQLPRLVASHGPGVTLDITVLRDGKELTLRPQLVKLERPQAQAQRQPGPPQGSTPEKLLGIELQDTPNGVVVTSVGKADTDLRVGDVIVAADGRPVSSLAELKRAVDQSQRSAVLLRVRRGDTEIYVGLERR